MTVTFIQNPAISIDKSTDAGPFIVGDTITYSFQITNTGNVTLRNITISDPLPGLSAVTGYAVALAPGRSTIGTATYVVTQADIDAGLIVNTATATGTPPTGNPVSGDDSETVTFMQSPAISLDKSTDAGPFIVGDTITYSFQITNTGNVTLTNINISDPLPRLSTITGYVTGLAPGGSTIGTATYVVTQANIDAGSLVNTATATGTPPIGGTVSGDGSVTVTFIQNPAITVAKLITSRHDRTAPVLGDTIEYKITVENTGNVSLRNVTITDSPLVAVLLDPASDDGNGVLDVGETWVYTGGYPVTADDLYGPIVNRTTVIATDPRGHPVEGSAVAATLWANTPPITLTQHLTTCRNTPITFDLVARDLNIFVDPNYPAAPQVHPLLFSIIGAPAHGAISGNLTSVTYTVYQYARITVTYTPPLNFLGVDTVTFTVEDPFAEFEIGLIQITVEECVEAVGGGGAIASEVIINEVAWGGTDANPDDEWIELANTTAETIDLFGWVLRWRRKNPITLEERTWRVVELAGRIGPNGYFLMERSHDNVVSDIQADFIYDTVRPYHLDLSDAGEVMELVDPTGNVVDTVNADPRRGDGWPAGFGKDGAPRFGTMERIDPLSPDLDENWGTNLQVIASGLSARRARLHATARMSNEETWRDRLAERPSQVVRAGEVITVVVSVTAECLPHAILVRADEVAGGGGVAIDSALQESVLTSRQVEGTRSYEFSLDTSQLAPGTYRLWISIGNQVLHYLSIEIIQGE